MGVAGALGGFAAKAAAKIGLGAAAGSAVPGVGTGIGTAIGLGSVAFDLIPLIQDLAESGSDPAKIDAIKQVRDGMAQKLVEAKGIPMEQAIAEVNEQIKPLVQEQAAKQSGGGGRMIGDAIGLAGGLFLAKKAGMFGKRKAAQVVESEVAKEAAPAAEAVETAAEAAPASPSADPALLNGLDELMLKARLREAPGLPGGGGLDMVNRAVMPSGLGTRKPKKG